MRHQSRWIRALVLAAGLAGGLSARAGEEGRTQWKLANFSWVNRVAAEPGAAANDHPALVSEATLQRLLEPVTVRLEGAETPLFERSELASLAKAIREALASAKPTEDLILLSTQRRGGHFMDPSQGVTARLFVKDGALNLIVHDARLDFMDRYSADRTLPTFVYGSRRTGGPAVLRAGGAAQPRPDWLVLPLPGEGTPASPAAAAKPAPAPAAPAAKPGEGDYDLQYQRLKALKRMRDENLISEAEYQQKREAILKTL